jgi:hypothetical protein
MPYSAGQQGKSRDEDENKHAKLLKKKKNGNLSLLSGKDVI